MNARQWLYLLASGLLFWGTVILAVCVSGHHYAIFIPTAGLYAIFAGGMVLYWGVLKDD